MWAGRVDSKMGVGEGEERRFIQVWRAALPPPGL